MRRIAQPGPEANERLVHVPCRGRPLRLWLPAGRRLLDAIADGFAAEGFDSGTVRLDGIALSPFAYVMPALSTTTAHAAYYSGTFRPSGISRIDRGALSFGRRDGAPFFHGHALWREADGRLTGGHLMPDETVLAEDASVEAFGIAGARFEGVEDAETLFKLFEPRPAEAPSGEPNAYALRVRPNVDLIETLEAFCRERGIARGRIHGGVGSTIEARFTDGGGVGNFATEVAITQGLIDAEGSSAVDVVLVDYTGGVAEGALVRGDNPVLMTFELVLEVL